MKNEREGEGEREGEWTFHASVTRIISSCVTSPPILFVFRS